jgi:hypothetical protein
VAKLSGHDTLNGLSDYGGVIQQDLTKFLDLHS